MGHFERRSLPGGLRAHVSTDLERLGFLAAFLERSGGSSEGPYAGLNGSFEVGDDPRAVAANRAKVADAFGVPAFPVPGFVHGTRLMPVGRGRMTDGYHGRPVAFALADGLHTRSAGVPLGAFSADCVIAVMASPSVHHVALVHAGWRGLASGVVQRAAALFADPREVHVAIGPAIGPCHYEVGEDVVRAVYLGSGAAVTERRRGRTYLDLVGTTRAILRDAGVRSVGDTGLCTACERRRFFSYRRDGVTGRHMAVGMRLGRPVGGMP
jgi:YfiH family protein